MDQGKKKRAARLPRASGPRNDREKKAADPEKEQARQKAQAKKRNKLVKGGKLGRPKALTPEELRRGVEAYFASISYQEPVMREEYVILDKDPETGAVTFQLDKMGHRMVRQVPVLGANGKPLMRTVYIEAPGDYGLCNFLKISRDTWDRYGHLLERLEAQKAPDGAGAKPPKGMACGCEHSSTPRSAEAHRASDAERVSVPSGMIAPYGPSGTPAPTDGGNGRDGGQAMLVPTGGPSGTPAPTDAGDGASGGRPMAAPTDGLTEEALREARDYAEIYTLARGRVCAYLESAAETRGGKGAQFKLERIYGLTEKKDVRVDAGGSIEAYLRSLGDEERQ